MNANEVIANRAIQLAGGGRRQSKTPHPPERRRQPQPVIERHLPGGDAHRHGRGDRGRLSPRSRELRDTLADEAAAFADIVMIGRTHLQDATPVTLGQVISGWVAQLDAGRGDDPGIARRALRAALGGTAVGTGLNAPTALRRAAPRTDRARDRHSRSVRPPTSSPRCSAHDAIVNASAALRTLAGALMKIANDVRWYASGPRAGIGELRSPENEPGSSIMPGKINPTQCEALTMVAVHVFGNDDAVAFAGTQGNFQLNVYKPVMLHNVLESVELLADGCRSFDERCARGIEPDRDADPPSTSTARSCW